MSNWELDLLNSKMDETVINIENDFLDNIKKDKAKVKSTFTKTRNTILRIIDESDDTSKRNEIKDLQQKLETAEETAMEIMGQLYNEYKQRKEVQNIRKTVKEMEQMETEFTETINECQCYLISTKDNSSVAFNPNANSEYADNYEVPVTADVVHPENDGVNNSAEIGKDMWKQLRRIAIPVFAGEKRNYESWKAAFMSCVDRAPATPEYKLLQLRQYLSGEALKVVENLGYSKSAYEAAKERLERKYGGKRRQIARYLEELENFKPIREGHSRDIEKFADLIDITVVNLKDAGRKEELGNGSLYNKLQQKLPEAMLAQYHRWIFEKNKAESVESLKVWIVQEAEFQTIATETVRGLSHGDYKRNKTGANRTFVSNTESIDRTQQRYYRQKTCKVCNGQHGVWSCDIFKKMDVSKRWFIATEKRLCYRCLGDNHIGRKCTRSRKCGIDGCTEVHNRMLHKPSVRTIDRRDSIDNSKNKCVREDARSTESLDKSTSEQLQEGEKQPRTMVAKGKTEVNHVTLRTVPVILRNGNRKLKVNALLDDASTRTYINSDVAAELGLQGRTQTMTVNVLNGECETFESMPVECELESSNGHTKTNIVAFTTDNVTGDLKPINWQTHGAKWEHLKGINFPRLGSKPKIDMLIGLDYSDLHYSYRDIRGKPGEPMARLTPLGWTCIGNPEGGQNQTHFNHTYFVGQNRGGDVDEILKRFWDIESVKPLNVVDKLSADDKKAIEIAENSIAFKDGRYEIAVPWKANPADLPDNYENAVQRLANTEKRLKRNESVAKDYADVINSYIEKGYVRKVDKDISSEGKWYLPHFPVIRPEKETTKTRIVFDASAKFQGVSLNDTIHQGPKLQRDLFDVLLRFRQRPVAIVCDIAEMYLRVNIPENDKPYHRFLWRSLNTDQIPEVYEFNSVVFGINSSPFLAQYVSRKNAEMHANSYPRAAETVLKSTYMDDSMDSVNSDAEGVELYNQLSKLWAKAGMYARKWLSNSKSVLKCIPEGDHAKEVNLNDDGNLPTIKTLGILWQSSDDVFSFHSNPPRDGFSYTKRNFLSKVAMLFDPLGFIAPFTIKAKMLLQDMWISGYDWDVELDEDLKCKTKSWFSELEYLKNIQIPRCLRVIDQNEEVENSCIHIFVDASQSGYGAVVYIRHEYKSGLKSIRFVASKSKVAPLTSVSIPRLELMAAVLGLRLAHSVISALGLQDDKVIYWSDSTNVLWWIRGRSRDYKPFVANRIGEIHRGSNPVQWRYVPTKWNPADYVSRGRTVRQLENDTLWWNGPDFLMLNDDSWPLNSVNKGQGCDLEIRSRAKLSDSETVTLHSVNAPDDDFRLNPYRYSSWIRLVRVRAWVNRFIENCRLEKDLRRKGPLSRDENDEAEVQIIRGVQQDEFDEDYRALVKGRQLPSDSKLSSLNPRIDENGILRSDGRLVHAEFLPYNTRYPIILPRKNCVTRLIVKYYHDKGNHVCGTNHTLSTMSTKFWIVSGREEIRQYENDCYECRRRKAKTGEQLMAPLPEIRLKTPLKAFARTAVDYAGPFITVQGRGKRREKRYLCLFTCLTSRAVHLEMAYGLDTDSFLNAFYRMVNRRGLPTEMISDNGTNFVGADRELRELVAKLDKDKINDSVCNHGIKWHFNPPAAPHFGGIHETMIKSSKRAIYAILGNADVTDEELLTAFTGAESLLNSRPLTYQSACPKDNVPLTPNHFIHGQLGGQFAPESVDDTEFNPRKRWRRVQELVRHFWNRWLREWLPELNRRSKWTKTFKDLKAEDIVLVMNQNVSRGHWPLGRVLEVFPGKDGHVRVAKVRLGQTVLVRPISKLCRLELDD